MARCPFAEWLPTAKHGYPGDDRHLGQGAVLHSMEGGLQAALALLDGDRQASWHFSIARDGRILQHVDSDNIAWHGGGRDANKRFWGIEHEGVAGEPLTEEQVQAGVRLLRWLWEAHPDRGRGYVRQETLWEHNELTRFGSPPTACPSGRIPWQRLIADLVAEVTPAPGEPDWEKIELQGRRDIGEAVARAQVRLAELAVLVQQGQRQEAAAKLAEAEEGLAAVGGALDFWHWSA